MYCLARAQHFSCQSENPLQRVTHQCEAPTDTLQLLVYDIKHIASIWSNLLEVEDSSCEPGQIKRQAISNDCPYIVLFDSETAHPCMELRYFPTTIGAATAAGKKQEREKS